MTQRVLIVGADHPHRGETGHLTEEVITPKAGGPDMVRVNEEHLGAASCYCEGKDLQLVTFVRAAVEEVLAELNLAEGGRAVSEQKTYDLHGCERMIFSDWSEEPSYLERVSISSQAEARAFMADDLGLGDEDLDPQPIYMRWESPKPGEVWKDLDGFEYDGGWGECETDHFDAVPFWKDAP